MSVLGLDLGHRDTVEAEHWMAEQATVLGAPGAAGVMVCTHLVHGPQARVAISVAGVDPAGLPGGDPIDAAVASAVAVEHHGRRSGRAVLYPGVDAMIGTVSVGDVLTRSVIERVVVLGGPPPGIDAVIETRDFVRPQWKDGLLTLITAPAPAGRLAPFEYPNPKPCCGVRH